MAEKAWKPLELVKVSAEYLAVKGVPNARLDAELLLCRAMGLARRVDLYAGFEREISGKELAEYRELIKRRSVREPVSRILGRREFMGIEFVVTPDVLSPRPETELLVETVVDLVRPRPDGMPSEIENALDETGTMAADGMDAGSEVPPALLDQMLDRYAADVDDPDVQDQPLDAPAVIRQEPAAVRLISRKKKENPVTSNRIRVLDLGTGSGCIAVAVAAKLPGAVVTAVDASPKALAVAKGNAEAAGVADRIEFRRGDWFAGCHDGEKFDVILSNPPYLVRDDGAIWPEVSLYDPPAALYGGVDGLDCYRRIVPRAGEWLEPDGIILLEVGAGQAASVADMLRNNRFRAVSTITDFGGIERVVKASAPHL